MIHSEGGPRAHRKARTPSQRCKLGLPLTHPPIHIHCICPFSEQKIPGRVFSRVSNPYKSLWSGYFFCNVKDQIRHISFAIKRSAKLVHESRCQYNITQSMRQEIEFFCKKVTSQLQNLVGISDCSYIPIECQHSSPSVTVASKGPEDTHFPLAFCGTCHFLKRSSYERSYTKEITQMVYSF